MITTALLTAALLGMSVMPAVAVEQQQNGGFALPDLPYAPDALEPVIDAKTMETHHGKHHKAYVDNLNKQIETTPDLAGKSLDDIVKNISKYNTAVRNNGGGHWNHSFFWQLMGPADKSGKPSAELEKALVDSFGSIDAFKEEFEKAGTTRFGSGWAWLIVGADGKLAVTSSPNQDNPLMDIAEVKGTPVLGNDVWEHAYYLHYQNRRADYLKAWWSVVNWEQVSKNYAAAVAK